MRLLAFVIPVLAVCLTACATPPLITSDLMEFSGPVTAVDTGCHVDGSCTATVSGITVETMAGRRMAPNPVWGQSNGLPQVGERVAVRCRRTSVTTCTLEGDSGFYLRAVK